MTLGSTVKAPDNVDGVVVGVGMCHGMSIRRWWRSSNGLCVFGDQADLNVARIFVSNKRIVGTVRILATSKNYHVFIGGDC